MIVIGVIMLVLIAVIMGCGIYKDHLRTKAKIDIVKEIERQKNEEFRQAYKDSQ